MKYDDKLREQIKNLTLVLLYLNSFDESGSQRSWKGYDSAVNANIILSDK